MNPRDETHCFIVRVDGVLLERIKAHARYLRKRRGRRVSRAEAARDLFQAALGPPARRLAPETQLGLFGSESSSTQEPRGQ